MNRAITAADEPLICEWLNCHEASVDADGDVWVSSQKGDGGHWLTEDKKADYLDWRKVRTGAAARQIRSRAARTSAGGKQVAVMLTPAAAAKLTAWQAKGMTAAAAISRLLERSRP